MFFLNSYILRRVLFCGGFSDLPSRVSEHSALIACIAKCAPITSSAASALSNGFI
jgi:hypothetical protein